MTKKHEWLPGGYGHGLSHCKWCGCTDREAAFALGQECPKAPDPKPDLRIIGVAHLIKLTPEMTGNPHTTPVIISAPPPARHSHLSPLTDTFRDLLETTPDHESAVKFATLRSALRPPMDCSGFLLSDGSFATREVARRLAVLNGQAPNPSHATMLFSEDLW
jgi:hypothetical protein